MRIASWVFRILLFAPFALFVYWQINGDIGADPAKFLNHKMGQVALYYLAFNLLLGAAIAYSIRLPSALRFLLINRRWLGVTTFVYLIFHLLLYLTMEGFEPQAFTQILTKLYLILGVSAFLCMAVLAITSNNFSVRRLGIKKWKRLHRLVYLATGLITIHVMLIEKADLQFYGIFFAILWLVQLPRAWRSFSLDNNSHSPRRSWSFVKTLLFLISFLALLIGIQNFAPRFLPAGPMASSGSLADSLAAKLTGQIQVLALGENSHNYPAQYEFLNEVLERTVNKIDFVGFEIEADKQANIDEFMNGDDTSIEVLTWRISTEPTKKQFLRCMTLLRDESRRRGKLGQTPLKVIALDKPQSDITNKEWFTTRDRYMYERLGEFSQDFKGKGILFLGAAHLLKSEIPVPRIMQLTMRLPKIIEPLGAILENERRELQILRVWLDSPVLDVDAFAYLPKEWRLATALGKELRSPTEPHLLSTQSVDYLNAESRVVERLSSKIIISESFDYFAVLNYEISPSRQLLGWVLNPIKILGGILQGLVSTL